MTDAKYAPVSDVSHKVLVESRMRWLVDVLAAAGPGFGEVPEHHFVSAFLDKYPDGVGPQFDSWRALGPFTVESYTPLAHKGWATLIGKDGARHSMAITIDTSGLIRRIVFEPEVLSRVPRDFADLDEVLTRPDVTSAALVCRRAGDGWESLYERSADTLMPTGSVFKVYLLLAVARAIRDGDVRWEDEIELRAPQRSLPTGEMQDLPDGTKATVFQTAYNMFARSDNTASDMIIHHLGRDAVHRAVADAGHQNPDVLRPFVSSRELFEIGWGKQDLLSEWQAGDLVQRERLLERIDGPLTTQVKDLTHPVHDRGLDWFMSARDVSRALAALWEATNLDTTGKIREIVSVYPGVEIDRDRWPVTVFKGGSTPGAVMFCWLVVDRAGVEHVVVLQQRADRVGILRDGLHLRRLGDLTLHSLIG
ncbi:serine hydrolase [Kibdelosporangium philippinense]|uniref:Serine hydrolase n=1 Tax=Kibdelosporangium philippinense TaxID=211113 RepID=A0ABS8ZNG4_9PSEU|nr:serine hydrolase [Kibdelosporangium philippinense]MCE7008171.1 serine hydrolase [Kibdelosporangium philippinense]